MTNETVLRKSVTFTNRENKMRVSFDIRLIEDFGTYRDWDTLEEVILTPRKSLRVYGRTIRSREEFKDVVKKNINSYKDSDQEVIKKLLYILEEYHRNDSKKGTKSQMKELERLTYSGEFDRYDEECAFLDNSELFYDRGYRYGSGKLYK